MRNKLLLTGSLASIVMLSSCSNTEDLLTGSSRGKNSSIHSEAQLAAASSLSAGKTIITFYWIFDPRIKEDWADSKGTAKINIIVPKTSTSKKDTLHYTINKQIYDRYEMEGSGFFFPSNPNNPTGSDYWVINLQDDSKNLFEKLDKSKYPWGIDGQGKALVPFKSAAVDRKAIPLNSTIYVPFLDNLQLPDANKPGSTFRHNGVLNGTDESWSFDNFEYTGAWIDVFVGSYKEFLVADDALYSNIWFSQLNPLVSKETGKAEDQMACNYVIKSKITTWSSSTAYKTNAVVACDSVRYQALKAVPKGKAVSETAYWQRLTRK